MSVKRILAQIQVKDLRIKEMDEQIKGYAGLFEQAEKEFELELEERGAEILKSSLTTINQQYETYLLEILAKNGKLKAEIELQRKVDKNLQIETEKAEQKRKRMVEELRKECDPRRNVLRYKDFMTCTPDMEVAIPGIY
jgi:hypothetical protein